MEPINLIIDFPVLESVKGSQMQHGLKYENFQRYSTYCSRRLYRLRRSINTHQGVAGTAKARHQRARKMMDINNSMIIEAGEKSQEYGERMLMVKLFLAERAWAYSMQIKQESADQPRKRYHMIRRLKKAAKYAESFEKLCNEAESPCSPRTKDEATAYANYITGLYKLECKSWAESKADLTKALATYIKLIISIRKDEVIENYRQKIEEIRSSLKYCSFNLGEREIAKVKVNLPDSLQFHDIARSHALQELDYIKKAEVEAKSQDKTITKSPKAQKAEPETKPSSSTKTKQKVVPEDEEEDEKPDEQEDQSDDDEFEDPDDGEFDDDEKPQRQGTGIGGLVKGWLGGAWS